MRFRHPSFPFILFFLSHAVFVEAQKSSFPPNHEFLMDSFGGHFKCPYSEKWLEVGPEKAAKELGLISEGTDSSYSNSNNHKSSNFYRGSDIDDGRNLQQNVKDHHKANGPSFDEGSVDACAIGPGAIGGAHQHGFSEGYADVCVGTPAEGSPYMWPLRWTADVHEQGE